MTRMANERLVWWKKQQASGKLGHNFESLIRDFETERAEVERLENGEKGLVKNWRRLAKKASRTDANILRACADHLERLFKAETPEAGND